MEIKVRIADLKVGKAPDIIVTTGLGSCVAVVLYDKKNKVGGMIHFMLPEVIGPESRFNPARFAETGIPLLIDRIEAIGGNKSNLKSYIVGGATMFANLIFPGYESIGERNVKKAIDILNQQGIEVNPLETGGDYGRSVRIYLEEGKIVVSSIVNGKKEYSV